MECPYCHAQNQEGVRLCGNCRRPMPQAQALHSSFAASFATVVPVTPSPPLRRNSSALIPGTSLQRGRYLVKDVLGKSSLGATLLATDTWREGRLVVIKE